MSKLLPTCLFALSVQLLFAQNSLYEKGYLINLAGDTIRGLVQRQQEDKLSEQVLFQASENASSSVYQPFDIQGFGFDGTAQFFESVQYTSRTNAETATHHRFAKKMLQGYVSMFKLELLAEEAKKLNAGQTNITYVYILRKEGEWYTLDQSVAYNAKKKRYVNYPRFYGVLKLVFQDCPNIYKEIERVQFKDKDFISVVSNYNKCIKPDQPSIKTIEAPRPKLRWAVEGSMAYWRERKGETALGLSAGIQGFGFSIDLRKRLWVSAGLNYMRLFYYEPRYELKHAYLIRVPFTAKYYFPQGGTFQPFCSAGFTVTDKFFSVNGGAGVEFGHYYMGLQFETLSIFEPSPKLISLQAGRYF